MASIRPSRRVWITGLVVALALAGVLSYYASSQPDGLMKVAADQGFNKSEQKHQLADSPLAGYQTKHVQDTRLSGGLAGVIGVAATLVVGTAVFWAVRRRSVAPAAPGAVVPATAAADPPPGDEPIPRSPDGDRQPGNG